MRILVDGSWDLQVFPCGWDEKASHSLDFYPQFMLQGGISKIAASCIDMQYRILKGDRIHSNQIAGHSTFKKHAQVITVEITNTAYGWSHNSVKYGFAFWLLQHNYTTKL